MNLALIWVGFWIIKIAATTLGETSGDASSVTLRTTTCDYLNRTAGLCYL
jgi:uncharacterized membrane-anchored protein